MAKLYGANENATKVAIDTVMENLSIAYENEDYEGMSDCLKTALYFVDKEIEQVNYLITKLKEVL